MKRMSCVLLSLLLLFPMYSCKEPEEEFYWPENYPVEIRLYYEDGDPRAGQEILPGETSAIPMTGRSTVRLPGPITRSTWWM